MNDTRYGMARGAGVRGRGRYGGRRAAAAANRRARRARRHPPGPAHTHPKTNTFCARLGRDPPRASHPRPRPPSQDPPHATHHRKKFTKIRTPHCAAATSTIFPRFSRIFFPVFFTSSDAT